MATLAPKPQVLVAVVGEVVIKMRDSADDEGARDRMRFDVLGATVRVARRPFAGIPGAFTDALAYRQPLWRADRAARVLLHALG